MKKYYVIEREEIIFNHGENPSHTVEISCTPERGNMSKEIVTNGWCGETDNCTVHAHGAFNSYEEAHEALDKLFPKKHEIVFDEQEFEQNIERNLAPLGASQAKCPSARIE